jgi:hypothetical protein
MALMTPEEANAYRQPMLDQLGTDDPVEVQAAEVELWRRLLDDGGTELRKRPAPGEWSALECLGHMTDSELVTSTRYRMVMKGSPTGDKVGLSKQPAPGGSSHVVRRIGPVAPEARCARAR